MDRYLHLLSRSCVLDGGNVLDVSYRGWAVFMGRGAGTPKISKRNVLGHRLVHDRRYSCYGCYEQLYWRELHIGSSQPLISQLYH